MIFFSNLYPVWREIGFGMVKVTVVPAKAGKSF